jgi:hypothetical protein
MSLEKDGVIPPKRVHSMTIEELEETIRAEKKVLVGLVGSLKGCCLR